MKLSESVMTVLITLLGIVPFIWFTYLGKKAGNKSKKEIKGILEKEQMKFSASEFWNHHFIGIDDAKKQLVFIKLSASGNQVEKIDLHDVKTCHIDKITKDYKRDKKIEQELQTLNLELTFVSNREKAIFNFYDINEQLSEEFEMKRAEKWQHLILSYNDKSNVKTIAA
ncbi:MAG: hypothetical protein ACSHXF_01880 [Aquaticitalea sp.]